MVYTLLFSSSLLLSFFFSLFLFTVGPMRSTGRSFFTDSSHNNNGLDDVNLSESQTSKFLRGPVRR